MQNEQIEILNSKEACEFLKISYSTLSQYASNRLIPYTRPTGGKRYFFKADLLAFLNINRIETDLEINTKATNYILYEKQDFPSK